MGKFKFPPQNLEGTNFWVSGRRLLAFAASTLAVCLVAGAFVGIGTWLFLNFVVL